MRPCARCFIYNAKTDAVLLIERFKGDVHYWTVPGGGIMGDETPIATVIRELAEELDYVLESDKLETLVQTVRQGDPETYFAYDLEATQSVPLHSVELELPKSSATNRYQPEWVPRRELTAKLPYLGDIAQEAIDRLA